MSELQSAYENLSGEDEGKYFFQLLYMDLKGKPCPAHETSDGRTFTMSLALVPELLVTKYPRAIQYLMHGIGRFYKVTNSYQSTPFISEGSQRLVDLNKVDVMKDLWEMIRPGALQREMGNLTAEEKYTALVYAFDLFMIEFAKAGFGHLSVFGVDSEVGTPQETTGLQTV